MPLTPKQERFCEEYLIDLNATQAAIRSGYSENSAPLGFYVYLLINPIDNNIFYIGKGKGKRAWNHTRNCKGGYELNSIKAEIIKSILSNGLQPIVFILENKLSEIEAFEIEGRLIRKFKNYGLSNIASGLKSDRENEQAKARMLLSNIIPYERWLNSGNKTTEQISLYHFVVEGLQTVANHTYASTCR